MLNARYQGAVEAAAFLQGLRRLTLDLLDPPTKSRLREEAEHLKQAIGELKTKLESLEDRLNAVQYDLSSLVYPVNTLPNEILCHIFAAAVSASPPSRAEINRTRLRITAVCQHWRSVAIADPHLWTQTYYLVHHTRADDLLFEHFLSRTLGLPIKYTVTLTDLWPGELAPADAFDSVDQWEEASLTSEGWPGALLDERIDCPHLTKLTMNVEFTESEIESTDLLMNLPRLRELSIGALPGLLSRLSFPTHQLRKLTLLQAQAPTEDSDTILRLLTQLEGLEELSMDILFDDDFVDDEDWGSKPPIRLPRLSILSLGVAWDFILQFLDLPALTTLHLSPCYEGDSQLLEPCVIRSSANITSLSLAPEPMSYGAYRTSLSPVLNSVKHLTVKLFHMDPDEAMRCSADLARLDYLPNLESITLVADVDNPRGGGGNVQPFLEGIAMRIANTLFSGVSHKMKLTRLVLDSTKPDMIAAEDMRDLVYLQKSLRSMQAK
ncbi:hypothetical protein MIND_00800600 [Mycena indigotica]|uniref:F-box domain-containing protein n=1 Tax=Mycena indigotica TaxID=2126181 RepID=A0A8H6W426_9AGAR|nr:uncharacterized protein MIND_00800600 [Mycena indigotica]KAF7298539.1 hypothetical protein MIND_00800600 [Mycena indigotica]